MDECIGKINPKFEKKDFLRKAWISLAQNDAPLDIFNLDFSEVTEEQHRVFITTANYRSSWTAEIGNDRQEAYTDFETYYEKIPYTAYERKYSSITKQTEQVPVTKYREEKRQRQVTKYKTVTDWHSGRGEHSGTCLSFDSVDTDKSFDETRFLKDFDAKEIVNFTENELDANPDMVITDSMLSIAQNSHELDIDLKTLHSVSGDHNRGFSCNILDYDLDYASLIKVPEYKTTITYNGKTYEKKAFPIGNMTMSKAKIPNPISVEAEKKKLKEKTESENYRRESELKPKIWKFTRIISLLSMALLVSSIIVSAFVKYVLPVVICFSCAAIFFIISIIYNKVIGDYIEKQIAEANVAASISCENAIANYEKIHKAELIEALNKKLSSLGFAPVEEDEGDDIEEDEVDDIEEDEE